jgi:hypothetical protein
VDGLRLAHWREPPSCCQSQASWHRRSVWRVGPPPRPPWIASLFWLFIALHEWWRPLFAQCMPVTSMCTAGAQVVARSPHLFLPSSSQRKGNERRAVDRSNRGPFRRYDAVSCRNSSDVSATGRNRGAQRFPTFASHRRSAAKHQCCDSLPTACTLQQNVTRAARPEWARSGQEPSPRHRAPGARAHAISHSPRLGRDVMPYSASFSAPLSSTCVVYALVRARRLASSSIIYN